MVIDGILQGAPMQGCVFVEADRDDTAETPTVGGIQAQIWARVAARRDERFGQTLWASGRLMSLAKAATNDYKWRIIGT